MVTPRNRVLTEEEKRRVVWLNLDYCGGPPKNHSVDDCAKFMKSFLTHLPHLYMVTVTIARRNHVQLDDTFGDYFPTPYGFTIQRTYADNARVLCKTYVRDRQLVRHVSIPGSWWCNAPPEWKKATFDGIIVGKEELRYQVYVPVDAAVYQMRGDAVSAYASD